MKLGETIIQRIAEFRARTHLVHFRWEVLISLIPRKQSRRDTCSQGIHIYCGLTLAPENQTLLHYHMDSI